MFYVISFYLFMLNILSWFFSMVLLMLNLSFIIEWNMMVVQTMSVTYVIYIDWMSLIFISTVLLISSMVLLYSTEYMHSDMFLNRFMFLILVFVMSMIFVIISPNLVSILLGWDGLGLSSYCLVSYYSSKKSFNSGMVTILMNRVGDIMILIMISLSIFFGSWNFMFFNEVSFFFMVFILICSITKSAQLPFSAWLPLAMAAPTPVSSLVHSSTLVTAGVYLMIRFSYLFSENFLYFVMILSLLTMFMAGASAVSEFDLKKIIALSTLSQLSIMMMTISLNLMKLAFFHLVSHAMFKSLLFLCSGIIIHNSFNNQDIRFISMLNINMPYIMMTLNVSSLALCGMPFLAGFYSKDLIIEFFLMTKYNYFAFFIMFLSMSFTFIYTFRLIFYVSLKNLKMNLINLNFLNNLMSYSIVILLMMSIFYGSILNWIFFSSLNKIFLPTYLKLAINYFFFMSLLLMLVSFFLKKISGIYLLNIMFYLNSMFFYSKIFEKNKMNIMSSVNFIIFLNELSWLEYLINSYIYQYIFLTFKYKLVYYLSFFFLMVLFIYMIILLMI